VCGIAGTWASDPAQVERNIGPALAAMRHRGPNDRGYDKYPSNGGAVLLGHTRLSIIDLSMAGHQPMHSADGNLSIVFNGEIYNYRQLRSELAADGRVFFTDSDTEVLLAAWGRWGLGCLSRLVGMFAFAVLDRRSSELICVRDAFGIKPLFYSAREGLFAFASEIPALRRLMPAKVSINWQRCYDYMVHGEYDTGPDTMFANISQLESGHWLRVDIGTGVVGNPTRWWAPSVVERVPWNFEEAITEVRAQFLANIRLHLLSDVPVGAALSGGIDSSAVVCAIRHVEPEFPIHTFSFIADGSDVNEEHWVDLVNSHVGAVSHKVRISPKEFLVDIDDLILSQGEPFSSTSIYSQYRVFKLAREMGVTVMLDGQGADEMLAGYLGFPGQRLRSLLETGEISRAWEFFCNWSRWPKRNRRMALKYLASEVVSDGIYAALRKIDGKPAVPDWIKPYPLLDCGVSLRKPRVRATSRSRGRRVIDELSVLLSQRGIARLLRHADRNSMRFSVESRVPFLTTALSDLLLSMPEDYLISQHGETKYVFREAMHGIVPREVLSRKDKIGFETPERAWLSEIQGEARCWLSDGVELPFLSRSAVVRGFDAAMAGQTPFTWQVWRWVNFYRWAALNGVS
jgi:asparagine synthase (glutamine-hydrolysing)